MDNDFQYLPQIWHSKHMLCCSIISEIEEFVLDAYFKDLKSFKIEITESGLPQNDIFGYLIQKGLKQEHDQYLTNHILYGLIIDSLSFLKGAFDASLKKRLTVSLALVRKPFVYNLVAMLRAFYTDDFLEGFTTDAKFDATKLSTEDLKELITLSIHSLLMLPVTTEDIYDYIFNQNLPDSIINISNKALHPSTTRNPNNTSGIKNINFIFSTESDTNLQWEYFYSRMPILMMYLNEILDYIIFKQLNISDEKYAARLTNRAKNYELINPF